MFFQLNFFDTKHPLKLRFLVFLVEWIFCLINISKLFFVLVSETNNSMSLSQLYYTHSWLPLSIKAELEPDGELKLSKYDEEVDCKSSNIYDLHAVVCYIHEDRKNLVSIVNVGKAYHEHISANNPSHQWYIFNDISVSPVIGQEAVWFSLDWKIPCILYWVSRNNEVSINIDAGEPVITAKVFTESVYLNSSSNSNDVILDEEIPKPGISVRNI